MRRLSIAALVAVLSLLAACDGDGACASEQRGVGDVRITATSGPEGVGFLVRFQSDMACGTTQFLVYPGNVNGQSPLLLHTKGRYAVVGSAQGPSFDETVEVRAELQMENGEIASVIPDQSMVGVRRKGSGGAGPLTLQPPP